MKQLQKFAIVIGLLFLLIAAFGDGHYTLQQWMARNEEAFGSHFIVFVLGFALGWIVGVYELSVWARTVFIRRK